MKQFAKKQEMTAIKRLFGEKTRTQGDISGLLIIMVIVYMLH